MSYLDVPRLHFTGTFMANPSTINNNITNYNPASTAALDLSWNPYGSHAWTVNGTVTSFVDAAGALHTAGDPVIGASFASYAPQVPAKLVDLDTDQQGVTRLFGLHFQLVLAGGKDPVLQGAWQDAGTLVNLWKRVATQGPPSDPDFGGAFQSVLQELAWPGTGGSPLLSQLQTAGGAGLSVRLTVYGYQADSTSPDFRTGLIAGTVGPAGKGEPLHLTPRLLLPTSNSPLSYAPAKADPKRGTVTFDLGNSVPDQAVGGPPVDLGTLEAAVLGAQGRISLGTIGYQAGTTFGATAGVVEFKLPPDAANAAAAAGRPLAVFAAGSPEPLLSESPDGLYIDVDGSSLYMNPGDQAEGTVVATRFGNPAAGEAVPLSVVVQTGNDGQPVNNTPPPPKGVSFPPSVTTDAAGQAPIPLTASDPVPREPRREFVNGQVYFLGGSWAAGNVAGAPLNVKVFNRRVPPVPEPTWKDVQPILFQYYFLYAYMAGYVDLSNYDDVVANASGVAHVAALPISDPHYMPVTREMSRDDKELLLRWIAAGCPR